jgi:hypothetical protein
MSTEDKDQSVRDHVVKLLQGGGAHAWDKSVETVHRDLKAMQDLVADPKTDLHAKLPWGDGQTVLREALVLADHNAYHVAQIISVRQVLGAW